MRRQEGAEDGVTAMYKIINAASAKAALAHRLATETVDIQVFDC